MLVQTKNNKGLTSQQHHRFLYIMCIYFTRKKTYTYDILFQIMKTHHQNIITFTLPCFGVRVLCFRHISLCITRVVWSQFLSCIRCYWIVLSQYNCCLQIYLCSPILSWTACWWLTLSELDEHVMDSYVFYSKLRIK